MKELCKIEVKRLLKQKFIYLFLFGFSVAAYAYSHLLTTPDLYDMLNINPQEASNAMFPEFMVRFYAITVGPLFMAFITSIYINEDKMSGMLKQPLLHGKIRKDILKCKFISLCGLNAFMMFAIYVITYGFAFIKWGSEVFSFPQFTITLQKYLFITLSLITMEALIILVSLYSRNAVILMGVIFCILMVDNLISINLGSFSNLFMFNYSTYYYLIINKENADVLFKLKGVIYDLIYLILFYYLAARKMDKIEIN
ncbi:MAG: ABC transporter permease [Lachnospiraceae bacterium]|nr:ABC transporter permease [Lachnospiraceae bacterium]